MEDLLGWFSLLTIFVFIFFWIKKYPQTKYFLLTAFLLRSAFVIIDQYDMLTLPDSTSDAKKFEHLASEFSKNLGFLVVFDFLKNDSLLISKIISIFYTIFGESKMLAKSIGVFLGTASVYLVYHLCTLIWNIDVAKKAAWVTALFPTLILYSSLTLREVYVVFFLLIGLIGIAKFIRNNSFASFLQVLLSFYVLIFFHGPLVLGGFVFVFYISLKLIKDQIKKTDSFKFNKYSFLFILISLTLLILFFTNNFEIPYLGRIETLFRLDDSFEKINSYMNDTASYPLWLTFNNIYDIFTIGIIKIFYFLYSPFIWDIKLYSHLIGFLDAILYFVFTFYVIKNRYYIWKNPITRILILILACYLIIYGIGIGNFGTAIRHRSKFIVILIVLGAPMIHKLIFSTKKKLYKK
tara:strand:+ start:257 stop:1480 length:1224 start_codon:yes stop_codon:yes gene_type:complete